MTSPIAAVRALRPDLSPAEAREVVLAVLGAVDVDTLSRAWWEASRWCPDMPAFAHEHGWDDVWPPDRERFRVMFRDGHRAAIDALVAEVQEEGL